MVTNPSAEDATAIADENARLKTLLETGMFKSLKGHQTLCDVLKRQILNRNPRCRGFVTAVVLEKGLSRGAIATG